jgi:hypothetical protein
MSNSNVGHHLHKRTAALAEPFISQLDYANRNARSGIVRAGKKGKRSCSEIISNIVSCVTTSSSDSGKR